MNLHEYQGKAVLASYGVKIQRGIIAHTTEEAIAAYKKLKMDTGTEFAVVKAQIHAGGQERRRIKINIFRNIGHVFENATNTGRDGRSG